MEQSPAATLKDNSRHYAWLGMPLAFVGLPLYLYLPKYFTETYGLNVALVGLVLLALRLADMVVDPLLGYLSDKQAQRRHLFMLGAAPLAAISYAALYWPALVSLQPLVAFALFTAILYLAYSLLIINYYAIGLGLADQQDEQIKLATARESMVLVGTLLAALMPAVLQQLGLNLLQALQITAALFALMLGNGLFRLRRLRVEKSQRQEAVTWREFWRLLSKEKGCFLLFLLFFVNALPVAITSTLFLFYADDVLGQAENAGYFLTVYFLAAAVAAPLWGKIILRFGQHRSLLAAMLLAVISFVWAYLLTPATASYFYLICFFSGAALAADMIVLPALLAQALQKYQHLGALGFAFWQALGKWSLALAAGIMLPMLGYFGYQADAAGGENAAVVAAGYALAPCILKLVAMGLVWRHYRLGYGDNNATSF